MKRRFLLTLSVAAVALMAASSSSSTSSSSSSSSVWTLDDDRGAFQSAVLADQQDEAQDATFRSEEESSLLFPLPAGSGSASSAEDLSPFVTVPYKEKEIPLIDVARQEWFAPYVRDMVERGIVSGYKDRRGIPTGLFGPANSVTIEELAKMAVIASGINQAACAMPAKNQQAIFSWSHQYIACAEQHDFVVYSDGSVDPKRPALRKEVVVTILQAFGVSVSDPIIGVAFKDVGSSTEFASAIERAARDGLVSGYADIDGNLTGYFGPETTVNRAEVAKMLSLAIQLYSGQ